MPILAIRKRAAFERLLARKQFISARAGQAILESCLVIGLICVIFMIILQIAELSAAREVLYYSAACSARCRTVGFNRFMVQKTGRVASIPNAGRLITPEFLNEDAYLRNLIRTRKPGDLFVNVAVNQSPQSAQYGLERSRIPEYMAAGNMSRAEYILNYSNWNSIVSDPGAGQFGDGTIPQTLHVTARQDYNLWVPLHRVFYADDTVRLTGESEVENHYALYINDLDW